MPIYAYRCEACGHAQDVLQKMSDPVLTVCPACGAEAYKKQVTAAGFQLKGSGWYVTDFKGGSAATPPAGAPASAEGSPAAPKTDAAAPAPAASSPAPAAATPSPPAKPAASGGSSSS